MRPDHHTSIGSVEVFTGYIEDFSFANGLSEGEPSTLSEALLCLGSWYKPGFQFLRPLEAAEYM